MTNAERKAQIAALDAKLLKAADGLVGVRDGEHEIQLRPDADLMLRLRSNLTRRRFMRIIPQ